MNCSQSQEKLSKCDEEYYKLQDEVETMQLLLVQRTKERDNATKDLDVIEKDLRIQEEEYNYYKSVLADIITYIDDIKCEQTDANIILKAEAEESINFKKDLDAIYPEKVEETEEDDFLYCNIKSLEEQKEMLEENAKENVEIIKKLNTQLIEMNNECMLLRSNKSQEMQTEY